MNYNKIFDKSINDKKYYDNTDLRFNKQYDFMLSRQELDEYLSFKDSLVSDYKNDLKLKTFNSKSIYYCLSRELKTQIEDYLEVFYLSHEAFHAMRVSTECFPDSKVGEPSEESRQAWLKYKDDTFIYIVNNEIIGCAELEDAELDTISIKISEQGKGYGKLFTKYMTNMLIDRGYKNPVLWCVVGNKKARALYDSLGYKETSCWAFANKTINK